MGHGSPLRLPRAVSRALRRHGRAPGRPVRSLRRPAPDSVETRPVQSNHFAPLFLEPELFSPAPESAYAGSGTAISRRGTAWLSVWDARAAHGLDSFAFRAVKTFDLMLEGSKALDAFASQVEVLRARGVPQPLVPLPAESVACAMLRPFATDLVDSRFVVKRLGDSPPIPPGPLDFDIRH